jgi:transketolase
MAWAWCVGRATAPTALVLTRQNVPNLERPAGFTPRDVWKGGYALVPAERPDVVLVATGSEVAVAVGAAKILAGKGVRARVVSMPCRELFEAQPRASREQLVPSDTPVCVIEAARLRDWCSLVGKDALLVGQETFGASAPLKDLAAHFGFTPESVAEKVLARLA